MPVTTVNQEFHFAPLGNRSIYPVVFTAVCYVAGAAASIYISFTRMPAHTPPAPRVLALLAPLVGLFIAVPVFFIRRARVARFRIEAPPGRDDGLP